MMKTSYCIVAYRPRLTDTGWARPGVIVCESEFLHTAAENLEPGTVYGSGKSRASAYVDAMKKYKAQLKKRSHK